MRIHWKALICILGTLLFVLAPAMASASVDYFLVGVRHVYRIGPNRDAHLAEREEIEKNYADGVSQDQDTFNQHVANGADKDKESEMLNSDLDALADARDKSLGSIFEQVDYMRDRHPELRIQGDGPYQVIGVDMHDEGDTEVIDRYCVYAPWPGYVLDGPCYGGWTWGVWYTPGLFVDLYWGWFDLWPGGRFWGGFWGHGGRFAWGPHGFNDRWHGGKVGGGFNRSVGGFSRSAGAYAHSAGGYTHSGGSYSRSASAGRTTGGYSHSGSSAYAHWSTSYRSSSSTGYSHASSGGFSRSSSSGGYDRSGTAYGFSRSTGYSSHSGNYGGGYGHSSGSSRSSGGSGRGGSSSGSHGRGR